MNTIIINDIVEEETFCVDDSFEVIYKECFFKECVFYICEELIEQSIHGFMLQNDFFNDCNFRNCTIIYMEKEIYNTFINIKTKNDALLHIKHEDDSIRKKCEVILYDKK